MYWNPLLGRHVYYPYVPVVPMVVPVEVQQPGPGLETRVRSLESGSSSRTPGLETRVRNLESGSSSIRGPGLETRVRNLENGRPSGNQSNYRSQSSSQPRQQSQRQPTSRTVLASGGTVARGQGEFTRVGPSQSSNRGQSQSSRSQAPFTRVGQQPNPYAAAGPSGSRLQQLQITSRAQSEHQGSGSARSMHGMDQNPEALRGCMKKGGKGSSKHVAFDGPIDVSQSSVSYFITKWKCQTCSLYSYHHPYRHLSVSKERASFHIDHSEPTRS
ncbi:hypothetical protein K491DRAFT_676364 [Lophiostoma macrostomum CBS 122681]|uniref:Uncharacterized protein n=1 Tax=Lophiostoma macrostomum CBS 122681 TaxID=1314788 RepID=A0A6A6TF85_9PLEO|nr:hypothetical protein K491DRAFT_676364 [Lophiostoma macrostomum CBS 122681]